MQPTHIYWLTHWGWVTHICVSDLTSIDSDNDLSPGQRQAIIGTKAGILLKRPSGTNFSDFLVEILIFSFKKMRLKVSSAKRRPFCLGLNELNTTLTCWSHKSICKGNENSAHILTTCPKAIMITPTQMGKLWNMLFNLSRYDFMVCLHVKCIFIRGFLKTPVILLVSDSCWYYY